MLHVQHDFQPISTVVVFHKTTTRNHQILDVMTKREHLIMNHSFSIYNDNRIERSPIRSLIIQVIEREFDLFNDDYRPNSMIRSPVTN